jgi:Novel STAND NTPase 1
VVLLDGESGCGKSALCTAGLVPLLAGSEALLPLVIRDWGEDWVRGPLSAVLDAIFHTVSQTDRDRLNWTSSPDLAADTFALAVDLDARLKAVFSTVGRRPLLIADQFDDYQALHRRRFLDDEGCWLTPTALCDCQSVLGGGQQRSERGPLTCSGRHPRG